MTKLHTLTVRDLIETLSGHDPDLKVVFTADYGDRGHTEMALPIKGELDTVTLVETAYSSSGFAIGESDDDDGYEPYLVIR